MKLIQYNGPFDGGETMNLPAQTGYRYVHVGIQIPHRQPISYIKNSALVTDLTINGVQYRVNECDILEFDDLAETSWEMKIDRALPWGSIIDVIYSEQTD